jgi:hypothetical protein
MLLVKIHKDNVSKLRIQSVIDPIPAFPEGEGDERLVFSRHPLLWRGTRRG